MWESTVIFLKSCVFLAKLSSIWAERKFRRFVMIFSEIDYLAIRERQADLLRQAELDRLTKLARSTQRNCCCTDGIGKTCS